MADRLQRKRLQNREAQQKYRSRIRERMKSLEKEIRILKSSSNTAEGTFTGTGHETGLSHTRSPGSPCEEMDEPDTLQLNCPEEGRWLSQTFSRSGQPPSSTTVMQTPPPSEQALECPLFDAISQMQHEESWKAIDIRENRDKGRLDSMSDQTFIGGFQDFQDYYLEHEHSSVGQRMGGTGINTAITSETTESMRVTPVPEVASPQLKTGHQSLEERLEYLRSCFLSVSFSNFDSVVGHFYTADLDYDSIMSSEQRLSRQRHLPVLLAELRESVKTWSTWEAHGYCEEIIKSTESILATEKGSGISPDFEVLLELADQYQCGEGGATASAFKTLMKLFREQNPKMLALVDSLTHLSSPSDRKEHFHTTIVIMLLMIRPNVLPRGQMVNIIKNCLDKGIGNLK